MGTTNDLQRRDLTPGGPAGESRGAEVELIREAFSYARRFTGKSFVVKLDSSIIDRPEFPVLVKDLALVARTGMRLVLVPGATRRIDEVLAREGKELGWVGERRISSPELIPEVKMAAFDVANRLMTLLAADGITAVIGNWVRARSLGVVDGVDYQSTGTVDKVRLSVLQRVLDDGLVPIFPCIGWSATGKPYNISSDELAAAIAGELRAEKLLFIGEPDGVVSRKHNIELESGDAGGPAVSEGDTVSRLTLTAARRFLKRNEGRCDTATLRIRHAVRACEAGVRRVHLLDGTSEGCLLKEVFSNLGSGTMIHANEYESIRPMEDADVANVLRLMHPYVEAGLLLPRSAEDVQAAIRDYAVSEVDESIRACAALHLYGSSCAELAALAVDRRFAHLGLGERVVRYLLDRARAAGVQQVVALTTQASDWFEALGFREGDLSALPAERRARYDEARKPRVLVNDLSP